MHMTICATISVCQCVNHDVTIFFAFKKDRSVFFEIVCYRCDGKDEFVTIVAQDRSPWVVLAVTSMAVFAVMLDSLVLLIAFPAIQQSFAGVSTAELSWVLNGYTIVYGALLVPAGRLADLLGRKRMFILGAVIFTVASVLCGLASTPAWLIGMRALQAVGGAFLSPAALALVLVAFPVPQRTLAVALSGAVGALAVVTGPPLGAWIVQLFGWSGIFFVNLPIGLIAVGIGSRVLTESGDTTTHDWPDVPGIGLLCLGLGLLTVGLIEGPVWGWGSIATIGVILCGAITLGILGDRNRRVNVPVIDIKLFADTAFRRANLANVLFGVAFTAMFFGSVQFLTRVWGYDLLQAGLAITPGPLMVVFGAPLSGRLATRWGHRTLLIPGGLLYAAGAALLIFTVGSTPAFVTVWLPAMLLTGLGVALIVPLLSSAAVQNLTPSQLGAGSGVTQALRQFASVLGVAITVGVLSSASEIANTYTPIFLLMVAGGFSVSLISIGLVSQREHKAS